MLVEYQQLLMNGEGSLQRLADYPERGLWNARTGTRDGTRSGTRDPAERANRNALMWNARFWANQGPSWDRYWQILKVLRATGS